jgi:hypothetical protein
MVTYMRRTINSEAAAVDRKEKAWKRITIRCGVSPCKLERALPMRKSLRASNRGWSEPRHEEVGGKIGTHLTVDLGRGVHEYKAIYYRQEGRNACKGVYLPSQRISPIL